MRDDVIGKRKGLGEAFLNELLGGPGTIPPLMLEKWFSSARISTVRAGTESQGPSQGPSQVRSGRLV